MKHRLLQFLHCPDCGGEFAIENARERQGEVEEGTLVCNKGGHSYSVANYIPRFVGDDNYARGFGFQWHIHAKTQIDKFNGTRISRDRFYEGTSWGGEALEGQRVLEVGCGASRFTEIMLEAGMEGFSVDYSNSS